MCDRRADRICLLLVTVFVSRYEKLQRWDDALKAYTLKASQTSNLHLVLEATLGNQVLYWEDPVFLVSI